MLRLLLSCGRQFNGKQREEPPSWCADLSCAAPATVSGSNVIFDICALDPKATEFLQLGKAIQLHTASLDTGQQGDGAPCTVLCCPRRGTRGAVRIPALLFPMKTNLTFVRPSACALAAAALLQTAAFAAPADDASADTLPITVVTANRFQSAASAQTQSVSIITAEDIKKTGARTVTQALERVLGLPVKLDLSGTEGGSVDLRGYGATAWSNQVIMVDGLRLNEGDLSAPRLGSIAIDNIERIEVVRGASSVIYGEGASAGAILITTKAGAGVARKSSGSITAGLGSKNQRELAANATFATGGFSMDVGAQKRKSDNHRQNFASDSENLSVAAQWTNDWLRIGANIGKDTNHSGLPGPLTAAQYAQNPRQAKTPNDWASQNTNQHGLFAQAQMGNWELAADLGRRDKKARAEYSGIVYGSDIDAHNANLRARHQLKTDAFQNALTVGYDEAQWKVKSLDSSKIAHSKNNGFYIKDDLNLTASATQLSAGWRSEKTSRRSTDIYFPIPNTSLDQRVNAWEFGVAQPINKEWTAFGRIAKGLRMANVEEFSFGPGYTLEAQTSKDIEAGLRWTTAANRFELRTYRSRVKNEIGYDPLATGPFGPFGANVNYDPLTRTGIELDSRSALNEQLAVTVNAAVRKARFSQGAYAGKTVPLVPRSNLSLGLDWSPMAQHRFNARANWVSAQQVDFNNTCRVPSYNTLDAGYSFNTGPWDLQVQAKNLGNKNYYSTAFNCIGGQTNGIYPEAGRSFNVNLRREF